jgi:hypothetical protein
MDSIKSNNKNNSYDDDEYSYAGGCWFSYPLRRDRAKREECEKKVSEGKTSSAETDKILAQAVLNRSLQEPEKSMSPIAIMGIVGGSLLAITLMIVIIKKVKSKNK